MDQADLNAQKTMSVDEEANARARFIQSINNYVAPNPSPRNQKVSRDNSFPDKIEERMQADGHCTWGYVIYRSTYESDADWEEFMRRLHGCAQCEMEYYNGQDILDRMSWTVFDDRALFDGVNTATIRKHFKEWTQTAVQAEQSPDGTSSPVGMGMSPRYRYCIQVDSDALDSVMKLPASPPDNTEWSRWVKLIQKDWLPRRENPSMARQPPDPFQYEPVEGTVEQHVGWVKCPMSSVMVEYYQDFQDHNSYTIAERRPPAIIGYPWTS